MMHVAIVYDGHIVVHNAQSSHTVLLVGGAGTGRARSAAALACCAVQW